MDWLDKTIAEVKPDWVVNLGDTFDTHSVLHSPVKNRVMDHIEHCLNNVYVEHYFYVLGNHDFYKPDDKKYHAVKDWKNIEGLTIVDEVTCDRGVVFIPYCHNLDDFPKDFDEKICVAHQSFIGVDYGYMRPEAGVNADEVPADIIITGHVHLRQEFGKVIYPGTPFSQSINDIDQHKGLLLFDTETYEKKFIECPLPMWRGLRYEITPELTVNMIHEDLSKSINETDHWTVEITGPKAEIIAYQNSDVYKELLRHHDVKVKPKFTDKEKQKVKIEGSSMSHVVREYFDKVYKGSLDKDVLVSKSLEILNKVQQDRDKIKM